MGRAERRRDEAETGNGVIFHPSVLEWIRKCSGASFLQLGSDDASFYVEHGLVAAATGEVLDPVTRKPTGQVLYVLTRKAMRLAYPDGVDIRRFKCRVCKKETAGRMSPGLDEDGNVFFYPRKHRVDGVLCDGNHLKAETVIRRKKL